MSELKDNYVPHEDIMQKYPNEYHDIVDIDDEADRYIPENDEDATRGVLRQMSLDLRSQLHDSDMENDEDKTNFFEALSKYRKAVKKALDKQYK